MAELNITINLDNDAFSGDDFGSEVARILHFIAGRMEGMGRDDAVDYGLQLRDINGNRVGTAEVEGLEAEDDLDLG